MRQQHDEAGQPTNPVCPFETLEFLYVSRDADVLPDLDA
jgi:hypothetical protein